MTNTIQKAHYEIGDKTYLRVSPLRGVRLLGIKGKLAPRCVGPLTVLDKRGDLSYQLELPTHFPDVQEGFHVFPLPSSYSRNLGARFL